LCLTEQSGHQAEEEVCFFHLVGMKIQWIRISRLARPGYGLLSSAVWIA
jgi:hypothetical protein